MKEKILKVREIKLENRINNYNDNKNIVIIKPKHKEKTTKSVEFTKLKKDASPRQHINKNLSQNYLFDKLIIFTDDTSICHGLNSNINILSPTRKKIMERNITQSSEERDKDREKDKLRPTRKKLLFERNTTQLSEDKDKLKESDLDIPFLYEPYGKNFEEEVQVLPKEDEITKKIKKSKDIITETFFPKIDKFYTKNLLQGKKFDNKILKQNVFLPELKKRIKMSLPRYNREREAENILKESNTHRVGNK